MEHPAVGSMGRTLTALAPSGQVEVEGAVFQAATSIPGAGPERAAIAADRVIMVSGWWLDNQDRVVLLVADPKATTAGPGPAGAKSPQDSPPPPTSEERLAALEKQLVLLVRKANPLALQTPLPGLSEPRGRFGWLLLTFGQLVSALGCLVTLIYALDSIARLAPVQGRVPGASNLIGWIVIGAILAFLYSAAMFVVFTRVKQIPPE